VIENGKARQQMVTRGIRLGNLFELTGGLKGDEILAASNLTLLATGVPVKVASGMDKQNMMADPAPGGARAGSGRGGRP
jgi:hypothetical protein